jgi:hypothetical protein
MKTSSIMKFLAYVKSKDFDFYSSFNEYKGKLSLILNEITYRDEDILDYKTSRCIPI